MAFERHKKAQLPTLENRMKVVDAYLAAFKKTPLIMLLNGKECTTYAIQHGAGWRCDSLGDLGSFHPNWNHMINGYPSGFGQRRCRTCGRPHRLPLNRPMRYRNSWRRNGRSAGFSITG